MTAPNQTPEVADDRPPFDPSDPFDAMAEMFRRQVCDVALDAEKITLYRDMTPQRQLECFLSGAMVGIVGVSFASIREDVRETMMQYLVDCLPAARLLAEGIIDGTPRHPVFARTQPEKR